MAIGKINISLENNRESSSTLNNSDWGSAKGRQGVEHVGQRGMWGLGLPLIWKGARVVRPKGLGAIGVRLIGFLGGSWSLYWLK